MNIRNTAISSLVIVLVVLTTLTLFGGRLSSARNVAAAETQEVIRLESRLTQLEQRLYGIEGNIQRLQQQAVTASGANRNVGRDPEVALLTSQLQVMQQQINQLQCGLARLDERTLSPAARQARARSAGENSDPCRSNPNTPLTIRQ